MQDSVASFNEIVECERKVMKYFDWNIMFLLPIHFVNSLLTNGVIFENEVGADLHMAVKITELSNKYLDLYLKHTLLFTHLRPSLIGAGIIYTCRKH